MIKLRFTIGSGIGVEVEGENVPQLIEEAAFFQTLPMECPICQQPWKFFHRHPQGFNFYGMVCTGTPCHEINFGQHKDADTLFLDDNKQWQVPPQRGGGGDYQDACDDTQAPPQRGGGQRTQGQRPGWQGARR